MPESGRLIEYSKRLGAIADDQFQRALDAFNLGQFVRAEAIPFGLFGQNVFVTSSAGEFVLRGTAHYDWQFPKEQFIAGILHDKTGVPAPYPYLLNPDESIFGWKHGYVLMPRLPGLQPADPAVLKTLSADDRQAIAYAMGMNLRDIQRAGWQYAGQYDLKLGTIDPFKEGFAGWIVRELRRHVELSLGYQTGATESDAAWVEQIIGSAEYALNLPFPPVLVMHDYKEANLTVEKRDGHWQISGVFDLMEALFGDGELDLVRPITAYFDAGKPSWAKALLDGYQQDAPLRPMVNQRLALYMVYDRLIVWEYFHRPDNLAQWIYPETTIETWINPYLVKLEDVM